MQKYRLFHVETESIPLDVKLCDIFLLYLSCALNIRVYSILVRLLNIAAPLNFYSAINFDTVTRYCY